jgi:hypothetical protein
VGRHRLPEGDQSGRPRVTQRGFAASGQRSAVSFRLLAFGCWRCGLTPGGARKIFAGGKRFDVWRYRACATSRPAPDRVVRCTVSSGPLSPWRWETQAPHDGLGQMRVPRRSVRRSCRGRVPVDVGRVGTPSTRRRWSAPARFSRSTARKTIAARGVRGRQSGEADRAGCRTLRSTIRQSRSRGPPDRSSNPNGRLKTADSTPPAPHYSQGWCCSGVSFSSPTAAPLPRWA